jgi:tetratricopeptide (TPR) repeat protein
MKRLRKISIILFSLLLMFSSALASDDYDKALDNGLRNIEPLSYTLSRKANTSDSGERLRLLMEASRLSPDLPALYFELSKSAFPNIFESIKYFAAWIKAYKRNYWWSLSLAGLLYVSLFISLFLSLAVIVLLRLPKDLPLIAHDMKENKRKLLALPILVLVSLAGPLLFIAATLSMTGLYFRRTDKGVVHLALILLILSPFFLRLSDTFLSASSPELRAIVSVNEGKDNRFALQALKDSNYFEARFSRALALKREGQYDKAERIYKTLLNENPDPKVYTNLGNIYAVTGQPDLAKDHYKKAVAINPTAAALYNLSQAYRDTLEFTTGDKYFREAVELDRDMVSGFTAIASRNPNRFVIDETLSISELRMITGKDRKTVASPFTLNPVVVSLIALVLIVLFSAVDKRTPQKAFRCSRCGKIICSKCTKDIHKDQTCPDCFESSVKIVDVDPKQRVASLLSAHERSSRKKRLIKIFSFAPPGVAQVFLDRVLIGLLFLWPFLLSATVIVIDPFFKIGLTGFSHGWLKPPLIILMVFLYIASTISINRRIQRGWV